MEKKVINFSNHKEEISQDQVIGSDQKIPHLIGYKFFKENEDGEIEIIRVIHARKYKNNSTPPAFVTIINADGEKEKIRTETLKEYTPLEPDGVIICNIIGIYDTDGNYIKDVLVSGIKYLNLKLGDQTPFVICRQNMIDLFNTLVVTKEEDNMFGCSVNQNDCPAGFNFRDLTAADKIDCTDIVNIYREDTLEDFLSMINTKRYDEVLSKNHDTFVQHNTGKDITSALFKRSFRGWCKDLETLLFENNFWNDINEMLGITDIEFDLEEHIVTRELPNGEEYESVDQDMIDWLSFIYRVPISEVTVLEYDHDLNLGDFNNARYIFLRNNNKKLYMLVYIIKGELKEQDLKEEYDKKDFSTKFRLSFYNKYQGNL